MFMIEFKRFMMLKNQNQQIHRIFCLFIFIKIILNEIKREKTNLSQIDLNENVSKSDES